MHPLRSAEVVASELHATCKVTHGSLVSELWTLLGRIDLPAFIAEMRVLVIAEHGLEAVRAFDR